MDLAARSEEIPTDPEELRKNYLLLKSAFDQVDVDLELQKEVYEERIGKLNNEISSVKNHYKNVLKSDEVKQHMEKKEKEIKELYKLIDQYSQSNKMVE